ncbi:MAG: exosome complex RNA-binding protein Rrp4 [Candidatus Woesearchaeota archaeon]
MGEIYIEDKTVAVPGELLAEGMDVIPGAGAYRLGEKVYANRVGLVSVNGRSLKLIPLSGKYKPKRDDVIICEVFDIFMNGWRVRTNTGYDAVLNVRDASNSFIQKGANLTKILNIGDKLVVKVTQVTSQNLIDVTMRGSSLKKLYGGQFLQFSPNKFPRFIGRSGSMVSMIKRATDCQIIVGQNGLIWVRGEPEKEVIVRQAIEIIEKEAHTSGLTERIRLFLEEKGCSVPEEQDEPQQHEDTDGESEEDDQNEDDEDQEE